MSSDENRSSKDGIEPATPVKLTELAGYAEGVVVSRSRTNE